MSTLNFMLAEQERWSVFLPTSSQRASEPSPPTKYQPDQNYAQGNQSGYGERFHSSNIGYGYGQKYASQISEADNFTLTKFLLDYQEITNESKRMFKSAIDAGCESYDQNYAQGNQCGYGGSFQSSNLEYGFVQQYASQRSTEQFHGGYEQQPTFNAPPDFAQQPQLSDVQDPALENFLQQLLQTQANSISDTNKQLVELKNHIDCSYNALNKIETINSRLQYLDNEEESIPPQETVMEEELPTDIHLPFHKSSEAPTEDSDIQKGEGCELHDQAKNQKLEVNLDYSTRPTERVKPSVMQSPEISNLNLLISNSLNAPSNDIGEVVEKTAHITPETLPAAEEVVQESDLLFECTVDENPVLRYEAKVGTVTTLSYPTKRSGEAVGMVGKALEHPCEGVFVVEGVLNEHPGITSTNEVNIAEPRKILFEKIRMNEFRGWFYDEYDPGDTWIRC